MFKQSCQQIEVKANKKWKYDDLQCRACKNETETQQHIYDCEDLKEINDETKPIYENVLNGSVKQSMELSKVFKIKLEKIEEIESLK